MTPQQIMVAIVDDEADMRESISQWLELSGFRTESFENAEAALERLDRSFPGVVITDIKMPGMGGMALLRKLLGMDTALPVIVITGHGDVPMAVEAMRLGAYDFIEKPFDPERLTDLARRAGEARRLALDNRALRRELADGSVLKQKLAGESAPMRRLREDILDIAQADGHVLIEGETGTGKSLVARALHAVGPRGGRPMEALSCAAHGGDDLMGRLFGPAPEDAGLPLTAAVQGGTLCLEDIETLPEPVQARLLAFIDGAGTPPETRIIAIAGHGERAEGVLRSDLYFRLAAARIDLPPLRMRGEDVLHLFTRALERCAEEYGCPAPEIGAGEAARLLRLSWPGNLRQLFTMAERAVLQGRRDPAVLGTLLDEAARGEHGEESAGCAVGRPLREHVEAFEKMLIDSTMRRHRGAVAKVMDELHIPRRTLNEKMAKYGLSRSDYL